MVFAPFFVITAVTGILLLWRKTGYLGDKIKPVLGIHNWEIVANYVGVILAGGLLVMTLTGVVLAVQMAKLRSRAKSA